MSFDQNNQYQSTAYGAQGGARGGGFVNQQASQGGSQASPGSTGKSYGKDTLRPVTIRQLLEAQQPHPDAEFKIDGTEVTFLGQIRNISTQATNVTYKLDDGTAIIEVKVWVDSDAAGADEGGSKNKLVEGVYARVWGRLKAFNNKRHVGAHVVRKIEDMNEVQYHLLEAAVVHCYFTKGPPEQFAKNGANGAMQQDGQSGVLEDGAGGRALPPMSPNSKKILTALRGARQNNEGLHVQHLAAQLGMQVQDAMKAGDELLSLGLIFTTVDDETWAILEF
ncbi:MAG: replication factor A protein 2 [Thelocarpon impressellum]|nr:MAG: replication factor A protein 2 [Thelocarpon impressellum]